MDIMTTINEFLNPELMVLVPVLYLVGAGIKRSTINDKFIPLILGVISIILATLYTMSAECMAQVGTATVALFTGITQGILFAGASVYINQMVKQMWTKDKVKASEEPESVKEDDTDEIQSSDR